MQEEWRPITHYASGRYEVSNLGRVRNVQTGKLRKILLTYDGYLRVQLYLNGSGKSFYVHTLVVLAFIGPRPDGLTINHKDGNKMNCKPDNFEFLTDKEQDTHARALGLKDHRGGKNPKSKLTPEKVLAIRSDKRTAEVIAESYGIYHTTVDKIRQRVTWKHL